MELKGGGAKRRRFCFVFILLNFSDFQNKSVIDLLTGNNHTAMYTSGTVFITACSVQILLSLLLSETIRDKNITEVLSSTTEVLQQYHCNISTSWQLIFYGCRGFLGRIQLISAR